MKNTPLLFTATAFFISTNAWIVSGSDAASNVYSDSKVEFNLPENAVPLEKQKCGKELVAKVPMSYTNFRCSKVLHNGKEYLILENTVSKAKRTWQYKIMAVSDRLEEAGDLDAGYTIVPVLVGGARLEFLTVNIDKWSLFSKKDRKVSYQRYQLDDNRSPSISPVASAATVAKKNTLESRGPSPKPAGPNGQGGVESANSNELGSTATIRHPVTPLPASPPSNIIAKNVTVGSQANLSPRDTATVVSKRPEVFTTITKYGISGHEQKLQFKGCAHYTFEPADAIEWSGDCTEGNVSGAGEMRYLRDDLVFLVVRLGPESDLSLDEGRIIWNRDPPYHIDSITPRTYRGKPSLWVRIGGPAGSNLHLRESIERVGRYILNSDRTKNAMQNAQQPIALVWTEVYLDDGHGANFMIDAETGRIEDFRNNEAVRMDNEIQGLNRDVMEQRAQKNNAMEQARIAQLRAAAEAEWPRRWANALVSDAPWPNTADILRHDLSAAIASLSERRLIAIKVDKIGFSDGAAIVSSYQRFTDIYAGIPEGNFTWAAWFDKTNAAGAQNGYRLSCKMPVAALSSMKVGQTYTVNAKLVNLEGDSVSLACENPRLQ